MALNLANHYLVGVLTRDSRGEKTPSGVTAIIEALFRSRNEGINGCGVASAVYPPTDWIKKVYGYAIRTDEPQQGETLNLLAMESQKAFESAIMQKALSANPSDTNYAGKFMFMGVHQQGTDNEKLMFKHIDTRHYLYV
jgi:hypothetical protein